MIRSLGLLFKNNKRRHILPLRRYSLGSIILWDLVAFKFSVPHKKMGLIQSKNIFGKPFAVMSTNSPNQMLHLSLQLIFNLNELQGNAWDKFNTDYQVGSCFAIPQGCHLCLLLFLLFKDTGIITVALLLGVYGPRKQYRKCNLSYACKMEP